MSLQCFGVRQWVLLLPCYPPLGTSFFLCQVMPGAPQAECSCTSCFTARLYHTQLECSQQDLPIPYIVQSFSERLLYFYFLRTLLSVESHIESSSATRGKKLSDGLSGHRITLPSPELRLHFRSHWLCLASFLKASLSLRKLTLLWSVLYTKYLCPPTFVP